MNAVERYKAAAKPGLAAHEQPKPRPAPPPRFTLTPIAEQWNKRLKKMDLAALQPGQITKREGRALAARAHYIRQQIRSRLGVNPVYIPDPVKA